MSAVTNTYTGGESFAKDLQFLCDSMLAALAVDGRIKISGGEYLILRMDQNPMKVWVDFPATYELEVGNDIITTMSGDHAYSGYVYYKITMPWAVYNFTLQRMRDVEEDKPQGIKLPLGLNHDTP